VAKVGGGRTVLLEIMGANLRTKESIEIGESEGKTFYEIIESSYPFGWRTFDHSALEAYDQGLITEETAMTYCTKRGTVSRGIDNVKKRRGEAITDVANLRMKMSDEAAKTTAPCDAHHPQAQVIHDQRSRIHRTERQTGSAGHQRPGMARCRQGPCWPRTDTRSMRPAITTISSCGLAGSNTNWCHRGALRLQYARGEYHAALHPADGHGQRRHAVFLLLGNSFNTLNTLQAFQQSVHAVVNRDEMALLGPSILAPIIQRVVSDNDLFLHVYRDTQLQIVQGRA
jgi:hypothetical protein